MSTIEELSAAFPKKFPAAIVPEYGKLEVADIPAHPVGPYDAVVRILACSVCAATDTHLIDGSFPKPWHPKPPFVLGHESVGRVVAIGPKVRNFKVGQHIMRPGWNPESFEVNGLGTAWGGFATWGVARDLFAKAQDEGKPLSSVYQTSLPIPSDMPARDATLFVTWRDCCGCLMDLNVKPGQRIVVFGTGANGMAFVRFATLMGAKAVIVGSPSRFALAKKQGAIATIDYRADDVPQQVKNAFGGEGAELAIEAVGSAKTLPHVVATLANEGKVFLFGLPGDLQFPINAFDGPETFTIVKKFHDTEPRAHGQTLTYYLSGQIDPDDFSDAQFPLERINDAVKMIRDKKAMKVTVMME